MIELVELATVDFDHFPTQHFRSRLACPVEKRAIDEAVALIGIDVADGKAERVQLALGKREQSVTAQPLAHCRERGLVETCQWAWKRHRSRSCPSLPGNRAAPAV